MHSSVITAATCADGWEAGVRQLLVHGRYSPSVRGPTLELVNCTLEVDDPRHPDRISPRSPMFLSHEKFSETLRAHPRVADWHGVNQVDEVVRILRADPLSRRAVIGVWDPAIDLEVANPQGVVALVFVVRQQALQLTSLFRTTDAWMANWTLAAMADLQVEVYDRLMGRSDGTEPIGDVALGTYSQFHASFHIYLDDVPHARDVLEME